MAILDPVENAERSLLGSDKSVGILARWEHIPHHYSRKRLAPVTYVPQGSTVGGLLPVSDSQADCVSVLRPIASTSETRFHRGFHRRMLPEKDKGRNEISEAAFQRFNQYTEQRQSRYMSSRYNIITGEGLKTGRPHGIRRGPQMVSVFDDDREHEQHRRVRSSEGRFHEPGPRLVTPELKCDSVLIGFTGERKRNRARSEGICDNFSHTQESLAHSISLPERRNKSQIVLG